MHNPPDAPDLLGELNDPDAFYTCATPGQRLLNWLVDNLLMRFGLSYVTGMLVGSLLGWLAPAWLSRLVYGGKGVSVDLILLALLIGVFNYLIYYTLCEKLFRGYTLGKLISGTRAIRQDGTPLRTRDAFMRTLVRLVPFEVLSGLGTLPWHDSWTGTRVVQAR